MTLPVIGRGEGGPRREARERQRHLSAAAAHGERGAVIAGCSARSIVQARQVDVVAAVEACDGRAVVELRSRPVQGARVQLQRGRARKGQRVVDPRSRGEAELQYPTLQADAAGEGHEDLTVDVTSPAGRALLVSGWAKPEPTGVWSIGPQAVLRLRSPGPPTGANLVLTMEALWFEPAGSASAAAFVSVAGRSLKQLRACGRRLPAA